MFVRWRVLLLWNTVQSCLASGQLRQFSVNTEAMNVWPLALCQEEVKRKKTFPSFLDFSLLVWINVALHLRKRELTTTTCVDYFSFGISIRYETQDVLTSGQQRPSASSEQTWVLVWLVCSLYSRRSSLFIDPLPATRSTWAVWPLISSESKRQKTRHL